MSDNQRRTVCRILFLVMCVLPTSAVGYWICHPQTANGWQLAIRAQLGVKTKIDSVETPGPNVTILRGLEFFDNDGKSIFYTVETEIKFGSEFNQIVIPNKVRGLTNEGLAYLIESLNQNVIRNRSADKEWIVVFGNNATIEEAKSAELQRRDNDALTERSVNTLQLVSSLTITDLEIEVGPTSPRKDGAYAKARFKVAGPSGNPISENVVRCDLYKTEQDGQVMYLNTNELALPCWLLANQAINLSGKIGQNAMFTGEVLYEPKQTAANLEMEGDFKNVAFVTLAGTSQSGMSIKLNQCKFKNGEMTDWDAMLYTDSDTLPKPIDKKYLFAYKSQLDISDAIARALLGPGPRAAQQQSDLKLR